MRNVFQNPGWYTPYTPYQAEIAQGRLEALLNFQTMVADLTGLPIANASLLDEGTAAAEAMAMAYGLKNARKRQKSEMANTIIVSKQVHPQTLDVILTRAEPLGLTVEVTDEDKMLLNEDVFAIYLQYPGSAGRVEDLSALAAAAKAKEIFVLVGADILSLALLTPPGEWGADVVVGNTQRFGVPLGYGGPHAAFFATKDEYKRHIPGRIIGVSVDAQGKRALRMALQTREQHIRRDKATSNICTAQALLAVMASMYAVYHGPAGIRGIAERVHAFAQLLEQGLQSLGYVQVNAHYFDTLCVDLQDPNVGAEIRRLAEAAGINFAYPQTRHVQIALDETVGEAELLAILAVFAEAKGQTLAWTAGDLQAKAADLGLKLPEALQRQTSYLQHEIFNSHHS